MSICLPAPKNGDAIGDLEHLVQLVADKDDRHAFALEVLEDGEQLGRFLRRQHCSRLVEDEDVRAAVERLQDLDPLLLTDRDVLDPRVRVDAEAELTREVVDLTTRLVVVQEHARLRRLDCKHDVLRDGHHGDEHEVLVHHPEPGCDRVLGGAERHDFAVHADLPLVGLVEPVQDVHERRLPRAVLAEQGVDFAIPELEVDVVVREDARELLDDPLHLEERGLLTHEAPSGRRAGRHVWKLAMWAGIL